MDEPLDKYRQLHWLCQNGKVVENLAFHLDEIAKIENILASRHNENLDNLSMTFKAVFLIKNRKKKYIHELS